MIIKNFILSLVIMILASMLAESLARLLRLPFVAILIVMGFVGSELIVGMGYDTGIRASNFPLLVLYVLLPIIIFHSAYSIDQKLLRKCLLPIMLLALPIMMGATICIAFVIYHFIGHPTGFPIYSALIAGALLAATDPMAVIRHLKAHNTSQETLVLLDGESLFNDAIGIVLFTSFVSIAVSYQGVGFGDFSIDWIEKIQAVCLQFFGGIMFGIACGLLGTFFSYIVKNRILENILLIAVAYGSFLIAEDYLSVSGMMAVLSAGLIMSQAHDKYVSKKDKEFINYWWEVISYFSNAMLFMLLGVTVTVDIFTERWLAMIIAIMAVVITRFLSIYAALPLLTFNRFKPAAKNRFILFWGGARGAVTAALALSIPTDVEGWWTIQSMAFGVIIFTLFIQAPTVPWLLKSFKK